MGSDDVKRMWVGGQVDEPIHTALLRACTMLGKHPANAVEQAVEEFIVNFARQKLDEGREIDDKILVTVMTLENRERENQISQLKQLAYSHLRWPSEESAERLNSACEVSGIAMETLMEEINTNQHVKELIVENGSLSNAELFLLEHMKPEELYPMREIISLAEKSGFKEWSVKAAKGKLGIQSKRQERQWVWILPKKLTIKDDGEEMVF